MLDVLTERYNYWLERIGDKRAFGRRVPSDLGQSTDPDWQTRVGGNANFEPVIQLAKWVGVPRGDCYLEVAHPDIPPMGSLPIQEGEKVSIEINNCLHSWEYTDDLPLVLEREKHETFPGFMWNMQWNFQRDIPNDVIFYLNHHDDLEFNPQTVPGILELAQMYRDDYGLLTPPDPNYRTWLEVAREERQWNAHVDGAYALSFRGRRHNQIGVANWGMGLLGYIWPPYLEDLDQPGDRIKVPMEYSPTQRTLTLDMRLARLWARRRVGPFRLDPDYGYTTNGASTTNMYTGYNYCVDHDKGTLGSTGNLDSISFYCSNSGDLVRHAVYDNGAADGYPHNLVGEATASATAAGAAWVQQAMGSEALTDQIYFCSYKCNATTVAYFYDHGTTYGYQWDTNTWASARPNPSAISSWSSGNREFSAYFSWSSGAVSATVIVPQLASVSSVKTPVIKASSTLAIAKAALTASLKVPTTKTSSTIVVPQSNNLCPDSSEFDSANWVKTSATVNANVANSPGGSPTADAIVAAAASAVHLLKYSNTYGPSKTYEASVYFKKGGRDWVAITIYGRSASLSVVLSLTIYFNLNLGTVGTVVETTGTVNAYGIDDAGSGWYRCWMRFDTPSNLNAGYSQIQIYPCEADADAYYAGNGTTEETYAWGARIGEHTPFTLSSTLFAPGYALGITRSVPKLAITTALNLPTPVTTSILGIPKLPLTTDVKVPGYAASTAVLVPVLAAVAEALVPGITTTSTLAITKLALSTSVKTPTYSASSVIKPPALDITLSFFDPTQVTASILGIPKLSISATIEVPVFGSFTVVSISTHLGASISLHSPAIETISNLKIGDITLKTFN